MTTPDNLIATGLAQPGFRHKDGAIGPLTGEYPLRIFGSATSALAMCIFQAAFVLMISYPFVLISPAWADEETGAVVLMYHRFGEDSLASTNIRLEQFDAHLEILSSSRYQVVPLDDVVDAMIADGELPENAVAITVDDVSSTILEHAFTRLQEKGFPFTVFVNTDSVGRTNRSLSWDDVRMLRDAGVQIGAHSDTHEHMVMMDNGAVLDDMVRMTSVFIRELGSTPRIFAYPFGEYSDELVQMVKDAGFIAAFGQHSGVVSTTTDPFKLPRFALNERYGEIERFASILESYPLPVTDLVPDDMLVAANEANPPAIGFTIPDEVGALDRLNCFASHGGDARIEFLGRRVEVRIDTPFPVGRSRVNCTIPYDPGGFRWLGIPFLVPG